ncbi:MAG TPA: PDZ domain-containing protein [Acidobacteriota bacterium]|nr:PDZ domain-containing protein [Acidobacteriota bacterium]HQG91346.1 PDZ domain-containing protein [Acidobacteriota bacterium]HQK86632.1 PDZ domain-containing protein [Acidobacteriota bacterium]
MSRTAPPISLPSRRRWFGAMAAVLALAVGGTAAGAEPVILPVVPVRVTMTVAGFEPAAAAGASASRYVTLPGSVMDNSAALSIQQEILLPGVVWDDAHSVVVGLQWLLPQAMLSETTFQVLSLPDRPVKLDTLGIDERIGLLIAGAAAPVATDAPLRQSGIRMPPVPDTDWKMVCVPAGRSFRLIPVRALSRQALAPLVQAGAPPILAPVFRSNGDFDGFCYPFRTGNVPADGWEWLPAPDIRNRVDYISRHRVDLLSGYLGVFFGSAENTDRRARPAVFVRSVVPASPAANAGLRPGDRVGRIGPQPVESVQQAVMLLRRHAPNSQVRLEVVREGETLTRDVVLGRRQVVARTETDRLLKMLPEPRHRDLATVTAGQRSAAAAEPAAVPTMGIFMHPASRQLRSMLGWTGEGGVLISAVLPGYPAAVAGLQAGDVLLDIQEQPVTDMAAIPKLLRNLQSGRQITVRYFRQGEIRTTRVTVK